jgi:hypothetical protein
MNAVRIISFFAPVRPVRPAATRSQCVEEAPQ